MAAGSGMEEMVIQFCAVTGAGQDVAERLLEACNGNLDLAIGMHMDQEEASAADVSQPGGSGTQIRRPFTQPGPQSARAGDASEPTAGAAISALDEELNQLGVRAPIPQRHEVLVKEAPRYPGLRGRRLAARSVFDGFRDFQAEARQQISGVQFAKKHTLEDLFRPPIDITFKGTFHSARDAGTSQNKWLLINVQNVQEFACQVLNRDIWSSSSVKSLIREHFVFWQVYHDSEEGKKYMQFYKVSQWPYVAALDPITGENLATWHRVEQSSFTDLLNMFLLDHPNPESSSGLPPAKRQKRTDSIVDASEEAQLEAAIQASLTQHVEPKPVQSLTAGTPQPNSHASGFITIDSGSECGTDELETFSDSEDNSSHDTLPQTVTAGTSSQEAQSPLRRGLPSTLSHFPTRQRSHGSRNHVGGSSSSAVEASGIPLLRPAVVGRVEAGTGEDGVGQPSTSAAQWRGDSLRPVDESENESSQGWRGSHGNTPNSMEMLGGRSSEVHTVDSSSNSSLAGSTIVNVDDELDSDSFDGDDKKCVDTEGSPDASLWQQYFGDVTDPETNLVLRFPDGQKDLLTLPCSSRLKALFVFCTAKGFDPEKFELVVNFPRRQLSSLNPDLTVKDAKLHPQETIFVQSR